MTIEVQLIFYISIVLVWLKAIIGFHFPWEKCKCCGKKFKNHDK